MNETQFLGLYGWQWGNVAGLLLGTFAAVVLIRLLVNQLLRRLFGTESSERTRHSVRRSILLLALGFLLRPFLPLLRVPEEAARSTDVALQAISLIGTILLIYSLWDVLCDRIAARTAGVQRAERLLVPILRKVVRSVIVIGGLLAVTSMFFGRENITGLLAGLGIGGLVLALAAKDSVENLFGSLTILFDMPFALGDWVKIGNVEGVVEEINLRSTRIRTFDDSVITLPNSNLIKASVENFGARRFRRQKFIVRISYDNQPKAIEAFCAGVRFFLETVPQVTPDRTVVELNDLAEPSAGVLVQCFFETESYAEEMRLRGELMREIFRQRDSAGLKFSAHPRPPDPVPEIAKGPGESGA